MVEQVETIVVGAGIAGLAYAQARGPTADLIVLEGTDRPGGLIRTSVGSVDDGSWSVEEGPEALQDNAPETLALLKEIGLEPVPAAPIARHRFILGPEHRLISVPTSPLAFLRSSILSPAGRMRALREPLQRRGVEMDGSVADFFSHRLGREVVDQLVDPMVSGIFAGRPEDLSLKAAFPSVHALVSEHGSLLGGLRSQAKAKETGSEGQPAVPSLFTLEGGMEALPQTLAKQLGSRLRCGTSVNALRRTDGGWEVKGEQGLSLLADRVVLALPVSAAGVLLKETEIGPLLAQMESESIVSVSHAWRREDVGHDLDGFGYLVPSSLGFTHLGTLFSTSIAPRRASEGWVVLRTFLGGARHPEILKEDDAAIEQRVLSEVGPILNLGGKEASPRPAWLSIARWKAALPRYDLDHPGRQEKLDMLLKQSPGLFMLGNHRKGISVNDLIEVSRNLAGHHSEA